MNQLLQRNISLQPDDFTVVKQHAKDWGQSFSSALRLIIREWQQLKRRTAPPEETDTQAPPQPHTLLT